METKVTKRSPISGEENTMTLPISSREYILGCLEWQNGAYIQDAFPTLNADEREFIKTGIYLGDW